MSEFELDPVTRITAGALGEPGQRVFYLQGRKDDLVVTIQLEKQQVALLAVHVDELLGQVGAPRESGSGVPDPDDLDLEVPLTPEFRVGQIGLAYDADRELVLVQCEEFVPEPDDEDDLSLGDDPGRVKFWATRGQVFAMARRGEREVSAGRPVCATCGESIDPDGHFCPRSNGHRQIDKLS